VFKEKKALNNTMSFATLVEKGSGKITFWILPSPYKRERDNNNSGKNMTLLGHSKEYKILGYSRCKTS
jgi:hypothetical protein